MSQTKSLDRIQEDYVAEGLVEQEALLARENSSNSTIIRADIHATDVATTAGGAGATEGATTAAATTDTEVTSTISAETGTTTTNTTSTTSATTSQIVGETRPPTAPGKLPKIQIRTT